MEEVTIKSVSYETLQKFGLCEDETGEYLVTLNNGEIIPIYLKVLTIRQSENFNIEILKDTIKQDGSMLFIKCKKLVIPEGTILTPPYRCRGMTLFCDELINNGKISMTAKGCIAKGQNILLNKNPNGEYETIPAVGGLGADAKSIFPPYEQITYSGNNGHNGVNRGLGGGGQGGVFFRSCATVNLYRGGNATSYSGGAGSGAAVYVEGCANATPASDIGGAGGEARNGRYNNDVYTVAGGTGNPGGVGWAGQYVNNNLKGTNGTGGLLIIYASTFEQNGIIESKGVNSLNSWTSGGASGGGSINIFYENAKGTGLNLINASGGIGYQYGGSGGNGCVTIGQYRNLFKKILVKYNNQYFSPTANFYNTETKTFNSLNTEDSSIKMLIDTYGIADSMLFKNLNFSDETFRPIDKFNDFRIVLSANSYLHVKGIKTDCQLITQNKDLLISEVKNINSILLTSKAETEHSDLKIAFSGDMGDTWFTVKQDKPELIPCTITCKNYSDCNGIEKVEWNAAANLIYENGISLTEFMEFDWNTLTCQKLRFAFVLKRPSFQDIQYLNEFVLDFDEKDYCRELKDTDCEVEVFDRTLKITSKIEADRLLVNTIV